MGISGLIPFLEKASTPINVRKLSGSSVAVDSYCWLHKGVYTCAEKLIRSEETDLYLQYCLKYVDLLLGFDIKIVMVFDGRHLPAKAETEKKRRVAREEAKKLAKECLRRNDIDKARSYMRRAIDVTHDMAWRLIKACRERGVDCVVAPYEADAQMAWLNKMHVVEYIITEDSDLTLFGAQQILFKLDLNGHALLVEANKFHLAMGCRIEKYTFDKFRRMCILSGCDYLDSLPGIGLKKACKFMLITEEDDVRRALKKLPQYLNMKKLEVTDEYIDSFLKAEATFRHMFIYNPLARKMQRLNDLEDFNSSESYCVNAGTLLDDQKALQLALGNLNPFTLEPIDNWKPENNWIEANTKTKMMNKRLRNKQKQSIWLKKDFQKSPEKNEYKASFSLNLEKTQYKNMAEAELQQQQIEENAKLDEVELNSIYKYASQCEITKRKRDLNSFSESDEVFGDGITKKSTNECTHNPFARNKKSLEMSLVKEPICFNKSLLRTVEANVQVKSRFFSNNHKELNKDLFVAYDLNEEMQKIEKQCTNLWKEQQQIYKNTPLTPIKDEENRPNRREEEKHIESESFDNDIKITKSKGKENCDEDLYFTSTQSSTSSFFSSTSSQQDEIVITDDEEDIKIMSNVKKQKTLNNIRSLGPKKLTKSKPTSFNKIQIKTDVAQPNLAKFGFQRRAILKKS
uniref:Exonuclease 1 n=1 Tax=Glossina brevipalpis TaxID=37001 RepID=A0A1A9W9Z0_9MUSC